MKIYAAKKDEKVVSAEPVSFVGKEIDMNDMFKKLGITDKTNEGVVIEEDGTVNREGRSL